MTIPGTPIVAGYDAAAWALANNFCQRILPETEHAEIFDGDGGVWTRLKNYPISEIDSVKIYDDSELIETYDEDDFTWNARGFVQFKKSAAGTWMAHFPEGFQNVTVTYTAGYAAAAVPADLQEAVTQIAAWLERQRTNGAEIASERLGDWAASYARSAGALPDGIKLLLRPYRRIST